MNLHELEEEYEILGELGRGGTAIVYRARDRELARDVAIKVVRSSFMDDQEAVARLAREAKVVAQLRHPSIVPLLSIRHLSDGLALIMQHVPGRTLKAAIREFGPLQPSVVEHVLREIGSALDYAHKRHNIIHRDIKPENIYLDEEINRALLADFGIARNTDAESNLTLVGTALGTPSYMSPEQIDGSTLDGRSDLFSLGLVAYEMLSGQQPWAGCNLYTIIYKQKHEELPAIGTFRNDVPRYLERVIDTLLRKNPADRYADAAQMIADIPAGGALTLPSASVEAPAPRREVPYDDAPTIRYQRPTFTIVEPHEDEVVETPPAEAVVAPVMGAIGEPAEPAVEEINEVEAPAELPPVAIMEAGAPEPVLVAESERTVAEAEETEEAEQEAAEEVLPAAEAEVGVETTVPTRSPWRLPEPRRVMLAAGILAPREAATEPEETDEQVEELVFVPAAYTRNKLKLVAALTLFLVLGGAATVVAMRNGDGDAAEGTTGAPMAAGMAAAPRQTLEKSSGIPASLTSNTAARKTAAANTEAATTKPAADTAPTLELPQVKVPEIAVNEPRQVSAADFSTSVRPTESVASNISVEPSFTPRTVEPELKNRTAVQRALSEYYPSVLRERNIGGTVRLWVLIDADGKVIRTRVNQSSGNQFLDDAAAKVADVMQFTPALDRDKRVSVWIQLPVIFKTR